MDRISTLLLLVVGPVAAFAHHSNAEFDFNLVEEYEGQVLEFSWINPHVRLTLERFLDWTATVTDPGTLTEPFVAFTTRWEWIPGEQIQPYDCAVR